MRNKHIKKYLDFVFEQDMMAAPMAGAPAAAPKKIKYPFIFVSGPDDEGIKRKKYPDGSVTIEYPCFSLELSQLEEWIEKNIISTEKEKLSQPEINLRKENLVNIVKGDKLNIANEDLPFIEKLKNAVSADLLGKKEPSIAVVYSHDGVPTTEDINVTFIKYKK
ncbi:hypothetical protein UFOVP699_38 [uncultured Caudovirales phage]|uniref:Uncharacterized protein n=1 Tax=uncultured Caudovirales phage TaxID=2100421 RepID=A0A6J5NNX8_9CAUD|nr:hypothetical protein UFOVP699_38 [uncultured Caudovirales phage]